MNRRELLALVGAGVASISGCPGATSPDTEDQSSSSAPTPTSPAWISRYSSGLLTVTAERAISVEVKAMRGDDGAMPSLLLTRETDLDSGEKLRVAIPAIADTSSDEDEEDWVEIQTDQDFLEQPVEACTEFDVSASPDDVSLVEKTQFGGTDETPQDGSFESLTDYGREAIRENCFEE